MKVQEHLYHLPDKAGRKSSEACEKSKPNFNQRAIYTRQLTMNYRVYVDKPPVPTLRQVMRSRIDDPSVRLQPKKSGPYQVVRAASHTKTINLDGLTAHYYLYRWSDVVAVGSGNRSERWWKKLLQSVLYGACNHAPRASCATLVYEKRRKACAGSWQPIVYYF